MTYPGSVWTYDDGTTRTCDAWEQVGLAVTSSSNGCKSVHTTYTVAAHTSFGYVQGNNELFFHGAEENTTFKPLVSETTGYFYDQVNPLNYQFGGTDTDKRQVSEVLDSMTIGSDIYTDVIKVIQTNIYFYNHTGGTVVYRKHLYYALNVGLIREEHYDMFSASPVLERNLVSYVIGPH